MEKFAVAKASSIDLAVEKALQELGVSRDRVEVEVLAKGGLFQKAEVKVTVIETAATLAEDFVNGILEKMGLVSRATAVETDGTVTVTVSGEDSGTAIGYRGEALDAIQFLARTYLNQEKQSSAKVVIDCENYREKRRETLTALALRLAEKAHRTCRKVVLEPMNPFERRIIHSALLDSEIAETHSEGEDAQRHVVIVPKGVEIKEDRRPRNGRREGGRRDRNDRRGGKFDGKKDFRAPRDDDRRREDRRERRPRTEEEEVPDGREYRGYYTDSFTKQEAPKSGPPKFKSFGGTKKF